MSLELTIDLKGARLEIEAESVAALERRLRGLDLGRIERAVEAARKGGASKKTARRAKKVR